MSKLQCVSWPLTRREIPPPGRADLWLTDLSALPLDAGPNGLSRKERNLKRRIQQKFVLRLLLGSYLRCPGKSVRLERDERGKPALAGQQAGSGLRFNLSHSGDWLAVVVGRAAIGVDIEAERRMMRARDLARRFFPADEARWLNDQDEPFLSRNFLNQWTAREALVKAHGSGLAGALGAIRLDWRPTAVLELPADWPASDQWSLISPPLPEGLVGHVAADHPGLSLEVMLLDTASSRMDS